VSGTTTTTSTTPLGGVAHSISFRGTWLDHLAHSHYTSKPILMAVMFALGIGGTIFYSLRDKARRELAPSTAGLNYVVGPMGSGKSMFGVGKIIEALKQDRYVITNVRLLPGWSEKLVRQLWPKSARNAGELARLCAQLEGRYVFERSLRTAMRYRVPCAICGGKVADCGHVGPEQEGRAVFVWDESHNDLNNRDYQGHGEERGERERERERRRLVIRWATQLRKLGFSGFLLSQHHENTDAQLRRVCNHIIRLQNQRQSEGGSLAKLLPRRFTVFLAYWYPAHLATGVPEHLIKPVRTEWNFLPWHRCLYDSWETFYGIDDLDGEDSPLHLPGRPEGPGGLSTPVGAEAPSQRDGVAPGRALALASPSSQTVLESLPGGAERSEAGRDGPASQPDTSLTDPLGDSGAPAASSG